MLQLYSTSSRATLAYCSDLTSQQLLDKFCDCTGHVFRVTRREAVSTAISSAGLWTARLPTARVWPAGISHATRLWHAATRFAPTSPQTHQMHYDSAHYRDAAPCCCTTDLTTRSQYILRCTLIWLCSQGHALAMHCNVPNWLSALLIQTYLLNCTAQANAQCSAIAVNACKSSS